MSNVAQQRVLRTVRLLPQAVKIGILETEIKQSGVKPPDQLQNQKPNAPEKKPLHASKTPAQNNGQTPTVQVKMSERNSKEIEALTVQVKALTNSLSNAEVANAELAEMSNQKISALLTQLINAEIIVRTVDKKKAYFTVKSN